MRHLLHRLAFWRQCPYHRYLQAVCFCDVERGEWEWN